MGGGKGSAFLLWSECGRRYGGGNLRGRLLPVAGAGAGGGATTTRPSAPPPLRPLSARDGCGRHATNGTVARYRTLGGKVADRAPGCGGGGGREERGEEVDRGCDEPLTRSAATRRSWGRRRLVWSRGAGRWRCDAMGAELVSSGSFSSVLRNGVAACGGSWLVGFGDGLGGVVFRTFFPSIFFLKKRRYWNFLETVQRRGRS